MPYLLDSLMQSKEKIVFTFAIWKEGLDMSPVEPWWDDSIPHPHSADPSTLQAASETIQVRHLIKAFYEKRHPKYHERCGCRRGVGAEGGVSQTQDHFSAEAWMLSVITISTSLVHKRRKRSPTRWACSLCFTADWQRPRNRKSQSRS